jgi:hypothetical protein
VTVYTYNQHHEISMNTRFLCGLSPPIGVAGAAPGRRMQLFWYLTISVFFYNLIMHYSPVNGQALFGQLKFIASPKRPSRHFIWAPGAT